MAEKIFGKLIAKQLNMGLIKEEDVSVYHYGYTLMLEAFINIVIAIIIGLLMNKVIMVSVFLFCFIPLRSFAGGYHTDKVWKCVILSNSVIIAAIWVARFLCNIKQIALIALLEVVLGIITIKMAPVQSINKKLSEVENVYYKKMVLKIYMAEVLLEIITYLFGRREITSVIFITHIIVIISLLAGNKHGIKQFMV